VDSLKPVTRKASDPKTDPDDDLRRSGIRSIVTTGHGYRRLALDVVMSSVIGLILVLIVAHFMTIDILTKEFFSGLVSGLVIILLLKRHPRR
jgi:uncharacterized protein YacL